MIIKCPACQTKFAVDESLLQAVETPRFQCSQCGKYFEGSFEKQEGKLSLTSKKTETRKEKKTTNSKPRRQNPEQLTLINSARNSNKMIDKTIPFSTQDTLKPSVRAELSSNPLESLEAPIKALEATQGIDTPLVEKRLLSNFTDKVATWPQGNTQPIIYAEETPTPKTFNKPEVREKNYPYQNTQPSEAKEGLKSSKKEKKQTNSTIRQQNKSSIKSITQYITPLLLLCLPPALIALGLLQWSEDLGTPPSPLGSILSINNYDGPQVPPITGLEVVETSYKVVVLDNGNQLLEILGNINNSTTNSFFDIQLEAKTYDAKNKVVDRVIVPAANGLTPAIEVNSLRHSSIKSLQSKAALTQRELKPGNSIPFRVMLDYSLKTAWYSVRAYSVSSPH